MTQDLDFSLKVANVAETITVVGQSDPVFSSGRTGAATAVMREDLASLPTITGRITDITRLTPQYGGSGTFAGQDNRANNMTVDGAYFNNSFGLGVTTGGIGDRTGVAPISLEAIEQVQVSVAPYDVRQGNFTGAGVNTVTRSGTNNFTASGYYRTRNESCDDLTNVDTLRRLRRHQRRREPLQPGQLQHEDRRRLGRRPDRQEQAVRVRPLREAGRHASADDVHVEPGRRAGGRQHDARQRVGPQRAQLVPRRRTSSYDTGPFDNIQKITPAKPWMLKGDYNVNNANKVTFRYNQLDSNSPVGQSGSSSLGVSPQHRLDELPQLTPTRTTRFSRTSSRASASGTRCSAT